jgi:NDP-sugar pyrophosphorylase family protein
MKLEVSREDGELLDTGGGLKKAAEFFLRDGSDEPILVHNVDVVSSIDLHKLVAFHEERKALATLAVQSRKSSRQLVFNGEGRLCGRHTAGSEPEMVCATTDAAERAFCGVHVLSPQIFSRMEETGVFPIIPVYLRLAGEGASVLGWPADEYYWRDLGTEASLRDASKETELWAAS